MEVHSVDAAACPPGMIALRPIHVLMVYWPFLWLLSSVLLCGWTAACPPRDGHLFRLGLSSVVCKSLGEHRLSFLLGESVGRCMVLCLLTQSCPTLCDPMDCSCRAPVSMGTLQARILERVKLLRDRQPFFRVHALHFIPSSVYESSSRSMSTPASQC